MLTNNRKRHNNSKFKIVLTAGYTKKIQNTLLMFLGKTGRVAALYSRRQGIALKASWYQGFMTSLCPNLPGNCYIYKIYKNLPQKHHTPKASQLSIFFLYSALSAPFAVACGKPLRLYV
jgi:hypothetical protein